MPALASGQGPTIHGHGQKWLAATKASNDASYAAIVRFFAIAALVSVYNPDTSARGLTHLEITHRCHSCFCCCRFGQGRSWSERQRSDGGWI